MASKNWESSKYFGMAPEEIKTQWKESGQQSILYGNDMHQKIEFYYNEIPIDEEQKKDDVVFKQFLQFNEKYPSLKPYRTE